MYSSVVLGLYIVLHPVSVTFSFCKTETLYPLKGNFPFFPPPTALVAQLVKNLPAVQKTMVRSLGWEVPRRRDRLPTPIFLGFPAGSDSKESTCNARDLGSILDWEDPLEKGMTTHSSILAWRLLWTEEPGSLQSMGSQRVGHD